MSRLIRNTLAAAVAMLFIAGPIAASELSDDLQARRARVMQRIGEDAILILWSAPAQRYSMDVDYEYRQDSNLYYLTGVAQEDTILVLMPGNTDRRELLFVQEKNVAREHWRGRVLSFQEASARTGIQTVLPIGQFESFVTAMLSGRPHGPVSESDGSQFFAALAAGRGRVGVLLGATRLDAPLTPTQEFARRIRERFVGFDVFDATRILTDLRMVKTPYEQRLLARSVEISAEGQMAGMRAARAGAYEYEVKAAVEAVHRSRGAVSWSFPSIVGSGPNATILHYPDADRQMQNGELLLVDAGCNYEYMAADVTRTYPVGGLFSQPQKDLYSLVLLAQEEAMAVARPNATIEQVHRKVVEVIRAGLLKLGLITDATGPQYLTWFTHGASHYIGIDVHDVGSDRRPLTPGMSFVIEPGLYIRRSALDALPRTPENDAFIQNVRPAVEKYADIGVRIEDSFLLEETGLRRLSAAVPRTVEEIEAFLRTRPGSAGSSR
jgi:Xaa-Pro aminopeptidase